MNAEFQQAMDDYCAQTIALERANLRLTAAQRCVDALSQDVTKARQRVQLLVDQHVTAARIAAQENPLAGFVATK